VEKGYCLNIKTHMSKQEKENLNGPKLILPDFGIHPHGFNVRSHRASFPVLVLREGRRTNKRKNLTVETSHFSVHNQKHHDA
jgi:hypothetical protein